MTEDADLREGFRVAQIFQACRSIAGEVLRGGVLHIATHRGACSAVVVTQRGDAVTRQIVGNDEEGFVLHQFLVAVLLTAARNHQDDGGFLLSVLVVAHRPRQRTHQRGEVGGIGKHHFLRRVGERFLGRLRTLHLWHSPGHHQGQRHTVLRKSAVERVVLEPCAVGHANLLHLQGQRVVAQEFLIGGNALRALVGTVKRHYDVAVALFQMEYQRQRCGTYFQFARPRTEQGGGGINLRPSRQCDEGEENGDGIFLHMSHVSGIISSCFWVCACAWASRHLHRGHRAWTSAFRAGSCRRCSPSRPS